MEIVQRLSLYFLLKGRWILGRCSPSSQLSAVHLYSLFYFRSFLLHAHYYPLYIMNVVRFFIIFIALLAFASAAPNNRPPTTTTSTPGPSKTTSTSQPTQTGCAGTIQCCQSLTSGNEISYLLELMGIELRDYSTGCGVTCSTMSHFGSPSCGAQRVCCGQNNWGGFVSVDCHPWNVL